MTTICSADEPPDASYETQEIIRYQGCIDPGSPCTARHLRLDNEAKVLSARKIASLKARFWRGLSLIWEVGKVLAYHAKRRNQCEASANHRRPSVLVAAC
jgi:hypothetical protein